MRKIYLLRHAEAESGFDIPDKDRPLTDVGKEQAVKVGLFLKSHPIETVLCSSAIRTQETLEGLKAAGANFKKIEILETLYNAPADILLEEIERTEGNALIIAHNPGIHQLAFKLAQEGDSSLIDHLAIGYSPATLSIFEGDRIIDLISPAPAG